jgi:predicted Zn-dependent protease
MRLPSWWIHWFTFWFGVMAQSESELAAVLAHEIGHVSQRHIARMIGNQRKDALLPMAGFVDCCAGRT